MNYHELEEICSGRKICIWGYGRIGKTFVLISLKSAGADITCYCDSRYRVNESFEGIPLVSLDELSEMKDIFVFIALNNQDEQKKISSLLDRIRIQYEVFDNRCLTELCNSLETASKNLVNKYRNLMDDELYLKIIFKQRMKRELDLDNPKAFNEKLQWLKINDRKPFYTSLVDKIKVKQYISGIIGEEHVIPALGIWDSVDDIDFDNLPNSFVLKCTHDSGSVIICPDKKEFDYNAAKRKLKKAMATNYYWPKREWPYKDVNPRIIAEEYVKQISEDVLPVYKFFAFGGKPEIIQTIKNDKTDHETIDYFDTQWNLLELRQNFPNSTVPLKKPEHYDEMLDMVKKICQGFRFVRVDFYSVKGKNIFSEITFYSDSGFAAFHPEEWDYRLGKLIDVSIS